jgi:hypothetical protein
METGVFTLWSLVHFFTGVALGFMFSVKWTRIIEGAGILAIPFVFLGSPAIKMIALAVMVISVITYMIEYFSIRKKKLSVSENILFALSLLIIWEIIEYLTSPVTNFGSENLLNHTSDIVVGFIPFLLTYFLLGLKNRKKKHKKSKK